MNANVFRPETVQANLRRMVMESPLSLSTLANVTGISQATLQMRLEETDCRFSVREVATIAMACGHLPEAVFECVPDIRPCGIDACTNTEHEWTNGMQYDPCRLMSVECVGFTVHGHLLAEGWVAWVDAEALADGHEGIVQARALHELFEQMQAQCDALNGTPLERHTEPGQPQTEDLSGAGL